MGERVMSYGNTPADSEVKLAAWPMSWRPHSAGRHSFK